MCEYCGCQEIPAIARLTAEHDAIVNLIGHIRAALDHDRIAAAAAGCRGILAVLRPHVQVEEEALFPALRKGFPDQIDSLLAEHSAIDAVLAEATHDTPADPAWPARLTTALQNLREHILKEQDGVFPATLAILEPADWDLLDQVRTSIDPPRH